MELIKTQLQASQKASLGGGRLILRVSFGETIVSSFGLEDLILVLSLAVSFYCLSSVLFCFVDPPNLQRSRGGRDK
jgi:hypothetical protein